MTQAVNRLQTFPLPDVGEGLTEAEILGWRVAVGDVVTVNQIIVEIETAKASVELPSPFAGLVHAILVGEGITVDVGTPIITIDTDPGATAAPTPTGAEPAPAAPVVTVAAESMSDPDVGTKIGEVTADGKIATLVGYVSVDSRVARRARKVAGGQAEPARSAAPLASEDPAPALAPETEKAAQQAIPLTTPPVRKLAKDLGVDLRTISPARADGVISRQEVQAAHDNGSLDEAVLPSFGAQSVGAQSFAAQPLGTEVVAVEGETRRVPIKGVRKATAAAMVASAFSAPHVTEFLTIDVTAMMELRDRLRKRRDFADVKLSPLVFAARAVCLAAARTPDVNASWDEKNQEILYHRSVHLGIAAATPRGLMVPNIKYANTLGLKDLATELVSLTDTARAGKTGPAQMSGGTFTITNVGVLGVDTGTPIINPGEVAILCLGSVKDAPWVVDGQLAVRKVCQLSLSFDHRVVDGEQGSRFLADVGELMSDPAMAFAW